MGFENFSKISNPQEEVVPTTEVIDESDLLAEEMQEIERQIDLAETTSKTPFVTKVEELTKNADSPSPEIVSMTQEVEDRYKIKSPSTENSESIEDKIETEQRLASLYKGAASFIEKYTESLEHDPSSQQVRETLIQFFRVHSDELAKENNRSEIEHIDPVTEEEVERYLLGDHIYENRMARLERVHGEHIPEHVMEQMRHTVATHYLQGLARVPFRSKSEETPWEDRIGPMQNLQTKTREGLEYAAAAPARELISQVIEEGLSTYLNKHPQNEGGQTLQEILKLEQYQTEWEEMQQKEDPSAMTSWLTKTVHELSLGLKTALSYESGRGSLQEVAESERANCAAYAMLGMALLDRINVPHVEVHGQRHAFVAYLTPDNQIYTSHFQGDGPRLLQQSDLEGTDLQEVADFIRGNGVGVKNFRIPVNSPLIFAPSTGDHDLRQAIYAYREVPPGLASTLTHMAVGNKPLDAHALLGHDNVQDTAFLNSDEEVQRAIESNPNDPRLYEKLFYSLDKKDLQEGLEVSSPQTINTRRKWRSVAENSSNHGNVGGSKLRTFLRSLFGKK